MQEGYKKAIITTALYTLGALIVVMGIFMLMMFFVFTKPTAEFMYNIGCDKVASNLYYKTYKKNGEIQYCYKALNLKVKINDNDKIIECYEAFVADDEYLDFMKSLKERQEKLNIGVLEKSSLLNEENYLTTRYVRALISEGDFDKALDIALNAFVGYESFTLTEQGVYAFNEFMGKENEDVFLETYDGYDSVLIDEIQMYFDDLYELFDVNKVTTNTLEKAYLVALGNRIVCVGQNINTIYGNDDSKTMLKNANLDSIGIVNDVIKGLI